GAAGLSLLVHPVACLQLPVNELCSDAPQRSAGPAGAERLEQAPAIVFAGDAGSDSVGARGGLRNAVAAERGAGPQARTDLADLRHLVQRVAHETGPGILDLEVAELRIDRDDVGAHHGAQPLGLARVGGDAAAPQQTIAVDDAVVVAGASR